MTKNKSSEFENFDKVMDGLLSVSYEELQKKLKEEKQGKEERKERRSTSSASRASSNPKKREP
jgi:hypothetical protein